MKKYLLTTLLILALVMTLTACGKNEKNSENGEVSTDAKVQENATDDVEKDDDITAQENESNSEASVEETNTTTEDLPTSDEPITEMVDFET